MTDPNIVAAGMTPRQSQWTEKALQELARLPVTEACVSGLCDVCPAQQACLCIAFGGPWKESRSSGPSGK